MPPPTGALPVLWLTPNPQSQKTMQQQNKTSSAEKGKKTIYSAAILNQASQVLTDLIS